MDMNCAAPGVARESAQLPLSVVGAVAFALALRLFHLSSAIVSPLSFQLGPDEDYYFRFGRAVAAGIGQNSPEFTFMDPGYGYLLGGLFKLLGPGVFTVFVLQCLMDAVTALGIIMIGRQIDRPRAGLVGAILYALASTAIMFCCSLLKEVWVTAFMTWWVVIALWVLRSERRLPWLAFGVFCGVGVAFRSTIALMALAALCLPFVASLSRITQLHERSMRAGLLAAGCVLALAPWSVRNFSAYGSVSPLPHNGGIVLHQAYNAENPDSSIWIPQFVNYLNPSEIWRGYSAEAERRAGRELTPSQIDGYWKSQALDFMRHNPGAVLRDVGRKALKFFASAEIPINRSLQEEGYFSPLIAILPGAAPWLLAMGFCGLIWLGREDKRWPIVALPIAIALLTSVLFWAEDRFRFHALGALALCSGVWVDNMVQRIRLRQVKPAVLFAALAATLFGTSVVLGATVRPSTLHWDQIVWGYIKMGRPQQAQGIADRVAREQPGNAPMLEALGYLAILRHDYAGAAAAYERALQIRPRSDQAHFNLAKVYLQLGNREQAREQAKIAASLKPDPDYQRLLTELESAP
jgi:tetratricopeptide (TPR) repeat protein